MASLLGTGTSSRSPSPSLPTLPTHVQEQKALRAETISAFHTAVPSPPNSSDEEGDDLGGLLTLREKTKDELERQEEEYRAYLEREVGDVGGLVEVEPPVASTSTSGVKAEGEGEMKEEGKVVEVREKKKKGKKGKGRGKKEETDQEFLMKCVCFPLSLVPFLSPFSVNLLNYLTIFIPNGPSLTPIPAHARFPL